LIEVMEKLKEKDSKEKLFKQNDRELFLNDENEQFDPKKFLELGYQYSSLLSSIKWLEKEIKFFSGYKLLGLNKDLTIAIDVVEKDREKQLKLVDQLINSISNLNYYSEEQKNEILMKLDNAKSELEKFSSIINSYSRYLEQNSNNLILN